ncbi:MAG: PKD domain-containing protein [Nitrospirae bacterium]|nr:PKD domain-containing protein [Nitrospirota bacterium]
MLISYFLMLCFFLIKDECFAQIVMPDCARLNPISSIVNSPTDVALDAFENVYVVESVNNRLLKFSQSGQYVTTLIGLQKPISVAVDNAGIIYIGNKNIGDVEVYNADLIFLHKLGSGNGEFTQPSSIDIDNNGNVYVVDYIQNQVEVFLPDGSYHYCFGCPSNGSGQFAYPSSIVIDKTTQQILILDHPIISGPSGTLKGARIQVFQVSGSNWTLLTSFGEYGDIEGKMNKPQGIEIDESGRIYVTESMYHIIYVYHSDCNVNGIANYCGKITDIANPMRTPMGIARSNSNRLFIASLQTGKVEIYGIVPYTNMQLTPLSLNFQGQQYGNDPSSQNVEIRNNGTRTLEWTANTDDNWITLSDISGSLDATGVFNLGIGINMTGLSPNIYAGTVTVRSDSGAAEDIAVTLNVLSNPPIVNPGGAYSAIEGQSILLNASNSSGGLVRYQWDIDFDGISDSYEYDTASPTQNHVYVSQGTYAIKLRVTDEGYNTDEAITSAAISDSIPSANFEGDPVNGAGPLTVNFINTSTGYDQPLTYEWDFDDNGIVDSTDQNPIHSYNDPGTYSVTLTVTDSDGSINTLNRPYYITVSSETCPNLPVRIAGAVPEYFNTLQGAYNSATEGDTIQSRGIMITENPEFHLNKTVTLEGGYDCDYLSVTGNTTINGTTNAIDGTVTISNFILN